ncbi:hypothetical protein [Tateyamaria sp.]|uniref:hypothetical protein n=1 Tax=Tateyamaria sp. TaxID=1929288 RepID=UPI0039B91A3C
MQGKAIATRCMLYGIIAVVDPISGAHFNPAVTPSSLVRRYCGVAGDRLCRCPIGRRHILA